MASAVFRDPLGPVLYATQSVDELTSRLEDSAKNNINRLKNRISSLYENINKIEPHRLLGKNALNLNELATRTETALKKLINKKQMQIETASAKLGALNPKSVLKRGYSITTIKKTSQLLKGLNKIDLGDILITELADENLIESKVINKQNKNK